MERGAVVGMRSFDEWPIQAFLRLQNSDPRVWSFEIVVPSGSLVPAISVKDELVRLSRLASGSSEFSRAAFNEHDGKTAWYVMSPSACWQRPRAERDALAWQELRRVVDAVAYENNLGTILGALPCELCAGSGRYYSGY